MRDLLVTRQFEKDISRISLDIRNRTDKIILKLRENPVGQSLNIKKLAKVTPAAYRVRIGIIA